MEVNFNKNSWHARFYSYAYGERYLPQNLCPYFWKVVAAIVVLPFTWIGYLPVLDMGRESLAMKAAPTLVIKLVWALLSIYSFAILHKCFGVGANASSWLSWTIGAPILGAIVFGFFYVAGLAIKALAEKVTKNREAKREMEFLTPKPKEDNFVLAFVKAKKQEYCPSINWTDGQEEKKEEKPVSDAAGQG
jgi:hypothetical protein